MNVFFHSFIFWYSVSDAVNSNEWISETKNMCGRYFAAEINGGDAALLLGLKESGRVSSRVEQYYNSFP